MKKEFKNISECVIADDGKAEKYIIVAKQGSYTLIYRDSNFQPWIVAYMYDEDSQSWGNGHYFDTLWKAVKYITEEETPGNIISSAIHICDKCERGDVGDLLMEMWQENSEDE